MSDQVPSVGRIVITWPAATGGRPLFSLNMSVHDYDTGEQINTVTGLRINLGGTNWNSEPITADLTMLINGNGNPLGSGEQVTFDDNKKVRTGAFRYEVVEMRVQAPKHP